MTENLLLDFIPRRHVDFVLKSKICVILYKLLIESRFRDEKFQSIEIGKMFPFEVNTKSILETLKLGFDYKNWEL